MTDALQYFFNDVDNTKVLDREAEEKLYESLTNPRARQTLVEANLKLALKHAHYYSKLYPNLDKGDLVSEANMGLLKAMEKFDPTKGFRFSTYAEHWIKNSLRNFIARYSRIVTTPPSPFYQSIKVKRLLIEGLSRREVMDELELSEGQLEWLLALLENDSSVSPTDDYLCEYKQTYQRDPFAPSGEDALEMSENEDLILELYQHCEGLSKEGRECINALYGLENQEAMSMKDLAEQLGKTTSMIKTLRRQSLGTLKAKLSKYSQEPQC